MKKTFLFLGVFIYALSGYSQKTLSDTSTEIIVTSSSSNTSTGTNAGSSITSGGKNTFTGYNSGYSTTEGSSNTFTGYNAGYSNITGGGNTFTGYYSGYNNTTGRVNTFIGYFSGYKNTSGGWNFLGGSYAGYSTTTGDYNTFTGDYAGMSNTTGSLNIFSGYYSGNNNTSGSYNVAIGCYSGPSGKAYSNTICIGKSATVSSSNTVRIGNDDITQIGGVVSWSTLSDGRYKKNIKENVAGLSFIRQLTPVSYELNMEKLHKSTQSTDETEEAETNSETQSEERQYIGLIAQDVEKVVSDSGYAFYGVQTPENDSGQYAIRYADFVMPLIKAVQELDSILTVQSEIINQQNEKINVLKALSTETSVTSDESGIQLMQNYPNPFSGDTEIDMYLPDDVNDAEIQVYTLGGQTVETVTVSDRGNTSITISGDTLEQGLYLYALIADGKFVSSKKMVVSK